MSEIRDRFEHEFRSLARVRDELRVQLDLGKKEAEDAWHEVEEKWGRLEGKLRVLARESGEALDDVGEAVELLVSEVKDGFERLRKLV